VVLQEIFGVNHHIRSVTDRYAAQGYLAIAPGLFDRVGADIQLGYTGPDMTQGVEVRSKTKLDETLADIDAAVQAGGGRRPGRRGRLLLGRHASPMRRPCRLAGIKAAVGYYGRRHRRHARREAQKHR